MARETNCEALCDIDLFLSWRKVHFLNLFSLY